MKLTYFTLIATILFSPVLVFADTDTSSTVLQEARIISNFAMSNFSNSLTAGNFGGSDRRALISFQLPDIDGTITDITLHIYSGGGEIRSGGVNTVYQLTQPSWVENQVTWNVYSTGNDWSTPGGDYDTSPLDTSPNTTGLGATTFSYDILGGSAINDANIDFNEQLDLIIRVTSGESEIDFETTSDGLSHPPYLEIEYTTGDPDPDPDPETASSSRDYLEERGFDVDLLDNSQAYLWGSFYNVIIFIYQMMTPIMVPFFILFASITLIVAAYKLYKKHV